jgi:hypothetical protein
MSETRQNLIDEIMQLKSVELLEYHDSNWLRGSFKTRSEDKIEAYDRVLEILKKYRLDVGMDNES